MNDIPRGYDAAADGQPTADPYAHKDGSRECRPATGPFAAPRGDDKPDAFRRLSHAVAELRAAMGYIGINHAQVCIGILDEGDNKARVVAALPTALRPSVNRQRSGIVDLDGITIHVMRSTR